MSSPIIDLRGLSDADIQRVREFAESVRTTGSNGPATDLPVTPPPVPTTATRAPAEPPLSPAQLSKEERLKRFNEWAGSWNPGVAVSVDREELYGGER